MEPILYLVHRIPFPPNKGDKVRSFNLLKFLASRYSVHLGTFVDDPSDHVHVARVQEYCATLMVAEIRPTLARVRSLAGFWTGEALTVPYYRDASLDKWVRDVVRGQGIRKAVVFSSAMAQYVSAIDGLHVVVDFVDVDSAKWNQLGHARRWPLSAVFGREGERLLAFERSIAQRADACVFVTAAEAELFRRLAPECAARVCHAPNGVDTEFFSPQPDLANPFGTDEEAIVFTGAMDYWPNIDAVTWFAQESLPAIVAERPRARFYVVGMAPSAAVQALARDPHIVVTGRVPDVRPYLQHARVVVAPLRVARGIQNKALEAMAMARPVVITAAAAGALSAVPGKDVEVAGSAIEIAQKTLAMMDPSRGNPVGAAARARVLSDYDWTTNLAPFDALLRAPNVAQLGNG